MIHLRMKNWGIHDSEKYYRELRMNYKKWEIKNYEFRMKNYDRFMMEYWAEKRVIWQSLPIEHKNRTQFYMVYTCVWLSICLIMRVNEW